MGVVSMDEERLKGLLKQALLELLQERKEAVYELLAELIEDPALGKAIDEGGSTRDRRPGGGDANPGGHFLKTTPFLR